MTRDNDAVAALSEYVADELAIEAARKSGIETRAVALVTVNFTAITLYLALSSAPALGLDTGRGTSLVLGVAGYCCIFICLMLCVAALLPLKYKKLELQAISDTWEDIGDGMPGTALREELIEVRIEDYKSIAAKNDVKALIILGAYIAWIIATTLLTVSLFLTN